MQLTLMLISAAAAVARLSFFVAKGSSILVDGHFAQWRVIGCDTCSVSYVGFVSSCIREHSVSSSRHVDFAGGHDQGASCRHRDTIANYGLQK